MIPFDYGFGAFQAPVARALAWLATLGAGATIAVVALVAVELRRATRRSSTVRSVPPTLREAA